MFLETEEPKSMAIPGDWCPMRQKNQQEHIKGVRSQSRLTSQQRSPGNELTSPENQATNRKVIHLSSGPHLSAPGTIFQPVSWRGRSTATPPPHLRSHSFSPGWPHFFLCIISSLTRCLPAVLYLHLLFGETLHPTDSPITSHAVSKCPPSPQRSFLQPRLRLYITSGTTRPKNLSTACFRFKPSDKTRCRGQPAPSCAPRAFPLACLISHHLLH